jgi:TPR repeat protein
MGVGVTQDFEEAANLYRRACNRRHAEGCYSLGVLYQNGEGVPRQPALAASLFRRACRLGYEEACESE